MDIQNINDDIKTWQWIGRIRVIKSKNLITLFIYTIQFGAYELTPNSFLLLFKRRFSMCSPLNYFRNFFL